MAIKPIIILKKAFKTNAEPTENDFGDLIDSVRHKSEKIEQTAILGLTNSLNDKASKKDLENVASGMIFKPEVPTVASLTTTYPNAQKGWAAKVTASEYISIRRANME